MDMTFSVDVFTGILRKFSFFISMYLNIHETLDINGRNYMVRIFLVSLHYMLEKELFEGTGIEIFKPITCVFT